jgi:Major Facilitator Superfamily
MDFLVERMRLDHTDSKDQQIHWKQLFSGLFDYKIWLYTLIFFSQSCSVYSVSFFLPTIITNMHISTSVAVNQALTVPVYLFGLFLVIAFAWSTDRFKDRLYHNIVSEIFCIIGFIILLSVKTAGVLYFATMLGTLCFASSPALMAWNNDNVVGTTKSAFAVGLMIMGGNLSGVLASQMYKDAPYYFQSHMVNFCLQVFSVILVFVLRFAIKRENRKLDERAAAGETLDNGSFRYKL